MAKEVGLSRNLKVRWMNKAAQLGAEGLSPDEYKAQLHDYLSFEISSPTNLRKTREILMRIWNGPCDETRTTLRTQALQLLEKYPEYDVEIQWCMLLIAYPVFADICKNIGRLSEFSETILLKQLKQKLFDEWGERTTLFHSADKIIATIKEFGVFACEKPGVYTVARREVSKFDVVLFLLRVAMITDGGSYFAFEDLGHFHAMFPFDLLYQKEDIFDSDLFVCNTFNGCSMVSLS